MSKQRIARALIALLMASLTGGIAHADETTTATIAATVATLDGVRFISSVPAVTMELDGINLQGQLAVTVAEIAKLGSDFRVIAKLAGPFSSTTTATDIPPSALSMATATVSDISAVPPLGGGLVGAKEFGSLDQDRQIYQITGQDANTAYSGVYLSTNALTLTIPEGTAGGAYVATVTITLQNF